MMIKRLVTKRGELLNPLSLGPTEYVKPGLLPDNFIIKGLLQSDEIGEKCLQDFILNETDSISFFAPIINPKLKV